MVGAVIFVSEKTFDLDHARVVQGLVKEAPQFANGLINEDEISQRHFYGPGGVNAVESV